MNSALFAAVMTIVQRPAAASPNRVTEPRRRLAWGPVWSVDDELPTDDE